MFCAVDRARCSRSRPDDHDAHDGWRFERHDGGGHQGRCDGDVHRRPRGGKSSASPANWLVSCSLSKARSTSRRPRPTARRKRSLACHVRASRKSPRSSRIRTILGSMSPAVLWCSPSRSTRAVATARTSWTSAARTTRSAATLTASTGVRVRCRRVRRQGRPARLGRRRGVTSGRNCKGQFHARLVFRAPDRSSPEAV